MRIIYHESKGLGDTIEKITSATGIKKLASVISGEETCSSCEERRKILNERYPYKNK